MGPARTSAWGAPRLATLRYALISLTTFFLGSSVPTNST